MTADSLKELSLVAMDMVENWVILEPKTNASILAERIITEADVEFLEKLGSSLCLAHFTKLIRAKRAEIRRTQQLVLPGFEHLPWMIAGTRGIRVALKDATYTDVREYCKKLSRAYTDRRDRNPKIAEAKALMDLMKKASQKDRSVTVGQLLEPWERQC